MRSPVAPTQRFKRERPCPICGGHDAELRGEGRRCFGFLSADRAYAHCTREDHAGSLTLDGDSETYAHRLVGPCKCGMMHTPLPPMSSPNGHHTHRIVSTYDYTDAHGRLLYQTVRRAPKGFYQRRPGGHGGWINDLKGLQPVIYRLPEVLEAIAKEQLICLAEGEEDVKALQARGYTATCNHGGAGKWDDRHSQFLIGAVDVVCFGDHDEAGRRHLAKQIASLKTVAIVPRIARMDGLPEHGDVRDWLKTHTQEDLDRLIEEVRAATDEEGDASQETGVGECPTDGETGEAIIRLAGLSPIAYDRARETEAKTLGIRVGTLDRVVAQARVPAAESGGQGQATTFADDDDQPWPEPLDGATLLEAIAATYRRYLILPRGGADILALWTLHTHVHDAANVSPLLALQSPQKRCGKTTTLQILSGIASRALPCSNITPAAIFRTVERYRPTLILDEADTYLSPEHDDLRGILNSGHTRTTAYVIRTVGDDHEPRRFCTWSPKAIALIGKLPDTLADRSITLQLQRKAPDETVERWRIDHTVRLTDLWRMAHRWADDHHETLADADPDVADTFHDRAADNWRPLLAIAEASGGEWPKRARQAIEATEDLEADDKDLSGLLLRDLRDLFSQRKTDRLASEDICKTLTSQEDRLWPTLCHGKPITQHRLARLLGAYGITSTTVRIGDRVAKGYLLSGFEDTFARYIPPSESVTTLQPRPDAALETK
jgi:hypothetical protein